MQSGEAEMDSIQALADFTTYLREVLDESCFEPTGNVAFDATVSYTHDAETTSGDAVVYLVRNGFGDGKVTVRESKQFDSNKVPTEYAPKWQTYTFDQDEKVFIVSGVSKYGYDYEVLIAPQ